MRAKVDAHEYKSFKEFETDFWRIVNNSQTYNANGSRYYNLAVRLGEKVKCYREVVRSACQVCTVNLQEAAMLGRAYVRKQSYCHRFAVSCDLSHWCPPSPFPHPRFLK